MNTLPQGLHEWYWTGVEFRCTICSKATTDEQALADMGEPT